MIYLIIELFVSAFCMFAGIMEYKSKRHFKSMSLLFVSGMGFMAAVVIIMMELC